MIVVDSSAWVELLRGTRSAEARLLRRLIEADADILVGDLVLCEVLQGLPDERSARRVETDLREFGVVAMVDESLAVEAAAHYRKLRAKGVTIRKTMDLLIGSFCLRHGHALLHRDRDFDAMEAHLGLRVARA